MHPVVSTFRIEANLVLCGRGSGGGRVGGEGDGGDVGGSDDGGGSGGVSDCGGGSLELWWW